MRIAMVTQWYDPEGGSAAIPGAIARALQARGHRVQVVTGFPNYPSGRLSPGYRVRTLQREQVRGVDVARVPLYPSHDRSAARRVLNFLTFMLSASSLGAWVARRSEVALVYSTPATVGLAGVVLRRLLRRPFVLYVQDVWPDTVTATGMVPARVNGVAERVLGRFCDLVYRSAAHVAVISPGMKTLLEERGVPAAKVSVVYNWVDESLFSPRPATWSDDHFDVLYAGNLGDVQGLETAVRAVASLGPDSDVRLRLIGSGVAEAGLRSLAQELDAADRVLFEGTRPVEEMAASMAGAHVQLVCLSDHPLFHLTMPSKLQAILACGGALVTSAPGDAAELTRRSGAGLAAPAGDVEGLAAAIVALRNLPRAELAELGRRGRDFYERELSAQVGSARLETLLDRATKDEVLR